MKTTKIIFAGLAALFMVFMTACSDDPQSSEDKANPKNFVKKGKIVQGEIDYNLLSRYSSGLKDATYTLTDVTWYISSAETNWKWRIAEDGISGGTPAPTVMILKEGKCWNSYPWKESLSGSTRFGTVLRIINQTSRKDYTVFTKRPIEINENENILTVSDYKFRILFADGNNLVLHTYIENSTSAMQFLDICKYTISAPFEIKGTPMAFDSIKDAYDWIIEYFKNNFGESINLNDYSDGSYDYTYPMVYLSDLISERDYYVSLEDGE